MKKPKPNDIDFWKAEGLQAWKDGKQPKDNPYAYDKKAAFYWTRGWSEAAIRDVQETQGPRESWPWPA